PSHITEPVIVYAAAKREDVAKMVPVMLEGKNYRISPHSNGDAAVKEAVELASQGTPVVLMSNLSSRTPLHEFSDDHPEIPIVVMTGKPEVRREDVPQGAAVLRLGKDLTSAALGETLDQAVKIAKGEIQAFDPPFVPDERQQHWAKTTQR